MISAQAIKQKMRRTIQKLLRHPASQRIKKKDLKILDFGCFEGGRTVVLAETIIEEIKPEGLHVVGVDIEGGEILEVSRRMGNTQVILEFVGPFLLSGKESAEALVEDLPYFDLITVFNPGSSDQTFSIVKLLTLGSILTDVSQQTRELAMASLEVNLGIDRSALTNLTTHQLILFMRNAYLEKPLREAFPHLLVPEGLLWMTSDNFIPQEDIRQMLRANGLEIHLDQTNDSENILQVDDETSLKESYDNHLFIATLPK